MGPRLFSRGNHQMYAKQLTAEVASMGPRLFSRGNRRDQRRDGAQEGDSMGPRLFSRGNRPSGTLHCAASTPSFNGAAAFQPRKSGRRASALCHAPIASMGPRLFSRGNAAQADYAHVADGASMGPRLFSRGNAAISRGRRRDRDRSFNGAAAFQPRKFVRVPER